MYLAEYTGKGVRIAVIDSGVHAEHPHVRGVAGGVAIREDGTLLEDYVDRLGHGTAVTAAIREKAPHAEILAIKVFWRALSTDIATLVRAIDEAADRGASLINLSLGTSRMQHRDLLEAAVARVRAKGALIVAANDDGGVRWLPGCLEHVVAVRADWACERDVYGIEFVEDRPMLSTSPYPRGIPGRVARAQRQRRQLRRRQRHRIRRARARSGAAGARPAERGQRETVRDAGRGVPGSSIG